MRNRFTLAIFGILLFVSVAIAAVVQESYSEIRKPYSKGVPTFLSNLSGITSSTTDSTTWSSTPLSGHCFESQMDGTLEVTIRSTVAGGTVCVVVGRRDSSNNFQGISDIQTATILDGDTSVYDGTGYYSIPLYFAIQGWRKYEVRVYDISDDGSVDLKPVMMGATAAAAE